MGTWYCDDCDNPFYAGKQFKCDNKDCECQDDRGRVACSKECHEKLFGKTNRRKRTKNSGNDL